MELYKINDCRRICLLLMVTIFVCHGNVANETIQKKGQEYAQEDELVDLSRNENTFPTRVKRSSTTGLVDIAKFKYTSGIPMTTYVDDTMTRLFINVFVSRSKPGIYATKPSGATVRPTFNGTATQGTVVATFDIPINPADFGIWRFTKTDANTWDVTIKGESSVYITHQLFELGSGKLVTDRPIIEKSYKLEVTVEGMSNVQSVDIGFLYSKEKIMPVKMVPLVLKSGSTYEAGKVTMPSEAVMVGIQGKDNSGHPYKRLDTNEIIPVTLKLDVPFLTGAFVEEHTSLNITFTLKSLISTTQDIDVRITDDVGLVQNPKVLTSNNFKPGDNFTGHFVLKAGNGGVTTFVKIEARRNYGGGNFSSGPIELRNITVYQKTTTTTSTTSATTTTSAHITTKATKSTVAAATSKSSGNTVSSVSNKNLADVARFTDTSGTGKTHIVYVDATMTRLIFQVTVINGSPVIITTMSSGLPYSGRPALSTSAGTVTATLDIPITSSNYGIWKFEKLDDKPWNVKIQAESPVHMTQQLFKPGTTVALKNPIPGKAYDLKITVTGVSNVKTVDQAFLVLKKDSGGAGFAVLVHKGGSTYVASNVKVPSEVFMIGIQGKDNAGHTYRRIDPTEIKPLSLELDVQTSSGMTVFEYSMVNITFTVTNLLQTQQEIDVRINDDRGYVQAPTTLSETLKAGAQFSGTFVLKTEFYGLSTGVTIKALPFDHGKVLPGPEEFFNFTVVKNETTTTASTTVSTTTKAPSTDTSNTDESSKLSVGTTVGIVAGCVIVGIIVGGGIVAKVKLTKKKTPITKVEPKQLEVNGNKRPSIAPSNNKFAPWK